MTAFASESDIRSQIAAALETHKIGNVDGALLLYNDVIPKTSGKLACTLNSNAGAICMQRGEYQQAHDYFSNAIEAFPTDASAHFNLAVVLTTKLNKQARAIKHCGQAIQLDPSMHKAYHLMGNILQTIGRIDDANKYFVQAESVARRAAESILETSPESNVSWGVLPISKVSISENISAQVDGITYTMTCVSERPLIFRIFHLLTTEECTSIVNRSLTTSFEKSFVMGGSSDAQRSSDYTTDSSTSSSATTSDPYRLSHTTWLPVDTLLSAIQSRLSALLELPLPYLTQQSEDLQVVRYGAGGRFKAHQDSSVFHPRLLTALMYLSDRPVGGGGETWFPFAGERRDCDWSVDEAVARALEADVSVRRDGDGSGRGGVSVCPVRGDALVFFNHLPDGHLDALAVHAGLPLQTASEDGVAESEGLCVEESGDEVVSAGFEVTQKWVANYWISLNVAKLKDALNQ